MGVGSCICQCNPHPRQADSIKVIVLCANGNYVLTLIFFFSPLIVFFPLALSTMYLFFHLTHGEFVRKKM